MDTWQLGHFFVVNDFVQTTDFFMVQHNYETDI